MQDYYQFTGGSDNAKKEKIWLMAKRFNQQSREMNGAVTCKRIRKVSKTAQLPLV